MAQSVFLNSSVALIAENQMPRVDHNFLMQKEIVSNDFVVQSDSNIPSLSQVQYNNGFQVIIEQNSKALFQVVLQSKSEERILSDLKCLQRMSSRFIDCFGNIVYQAVGINFDVIGEGLQYNSFVQKIMNSDHSYLKFKDYKSEMNSMNLSYGMKGKQLNVQIFKLQEVSINDGNKKFVPLFKINIHYPQNYDDNKVNIINEIESNYTLSKEFVGRFQ